MIEIVLGAGIGASSALLAALALLLRRNAKEAALLRDALGAAALWWWESDATGRVLKVEDSRRSPDWISTGRLLGRPFWCLRGEAEAPAPEAIAQAIEAKLPFFGVAVPVGADATTVVRLSAIPRFTRLGRFRGYAGAASLAGAAAGDTVADQRLAQLEEEGREQARQFALAANEMESFSYSVSHDLRAPLRVVDGFANIVLEDYGPRLDELGREHVKRIAAAANRMNAMIDALLAMSRRTGRELESEPVDLSRTARELIDELRSTDPARNLDVRIAPDVRTIGDPVLLRLVLQNLLGNAFKFSANAPRAVIEFGHHVVDGEDVYFVRDNGAGFDMRFADRLFGLFQRFHSANEYPGTGVGLATVQRIVRKHGGRVWAESEPGKGACFYFTVLRRRLSAGSN